MPPKYQGVPLREIAEAIGRGLHIPVEAASPDQMASDFGLLAFAVGMDAPAFSALTQVRLGWRPTEKPGLIAEIENSTEFET
jgi:hypothetical protein